MGRNGLIYVEKNYFKSWKNKLSAINLKLFEIGETYSESKQKLMLKGQVNFKDTSKIVNTIISQ
jgi:hypothetical protein